MYWPVLATSHSQSGTAGSAKFGVGRAVDHVESGSIDTGGRCLNCRWHSCSPPVRPMTSCALYSRMAPEQQ